MTPVEGQKASLIKGLKYSCTVPISKSNNDFYIEASNGDSKRRIPESYLQNGPWVMK
jgi:hypothetical protein